MYEDLSAKGRLFSSVQPLLDCVVARAERDVNRIWKFEPIRDCIACRLPPRIGFKDIELPFLQRSQELTFFVTMHQAERRTSKKKKSVQWRVFLGQTIWGLADTPVVVQRGGDV